MQPRNRRSLFSVSRLWHFICISGIAAAALVLGGCAEQPIEERSLNEIGMVFSAADVMEEDALRDRVDNALAITEARTMRSTTNAAWQIMHGVLGYGTKLRIHNDNEELVPAVDWILSGGNLRGWTMRQGRKFPDGRYGLRAVIESGTKAGQGHKDQWLAVLSQCDLEADQEIKVGKRTYTMMDMVRQAQWECYDGMEASWTVIGLNYYLSLDAEWTARDGNKWNFEKLIALEARQELGASACGGTHRLIGMTMLLNRYVNEHPHKKLTGGWLAADKKIEGAVRRAKDFQQADGAFSTSYFGRAGSSPDAHLIIGTTGHTLEFLAFALDDEEIKKPWMTKAAEKLCEVFEDTKDRDVECGALYHAAHGLQLYRFRRFGAPDPRDVAQADAPDSPQIAESRED
ncbi:MAG: hypothetical protein N2C14_11255 [Planctomycetales bacterium]